MNFLCCFASLFLSIAFASYSCSDLNMGARAVAPAYLRCSSQNVLAANVGRPASHKPHGSHVVARGSGPQMSHYSSPVIAPPLLHFLLRSAI
ncbi:hypothetical protein BDY21DRAFT_214216 [Lineolata rhizophorae]|uniref:Secreted protein n=1 Tax=Lineolata rhizophorae TaxID=578093 RepID=A0A6A6P2F9_9PEZI|nr:hypothetical protein BDY21DRAFT_214216 [Lineolata rhizophorae]